MASRETLPMNRRFSNAMSVGQRYQVHLLIDRGRGPREYRMVAVYLGWVQTNPASSGRTLDFSGRPAFGTTSVAEEDITGVWATDAQISAPKRRGR
jgi:hypothetical protein